ncbi:MAG: hypothetical protein N2316_04480 [Spirochaetes bacterium]|nr:hypothetical protein [Spirochaetota bacterium]
MLDIEHIEKIQLIFAMNLIDYKRTIHALKKRRKLLLNKLEELNELYHKFTSSSVHFEEFTVENGMLEILELIDIGYLRYDAFDIRTQFGEYRVLYYYGDFPFTDKGIQFLLSKNKMKKIKLFATGCALLIMLAFWIFFNLRFHTLR